MNRTLSLPVLVAILCQASVAVPANDIEPNKERYHAVRTTRAPVIDSDEVMPGQQGWGGWGAHAIVFGKSPSETAEITLVGETGDSNLFGIGLVAYWDFDGDLFDSIQDFHGTARGSTPPAYVEGKPGFGQCLQLDGTDQFVEITGGNENELEFPGGSMSIAGWFKVGAFDTAWQALIAKGEGLNYRVARRYEGNGIAYAGGADEGVDDVPSVNDGQWHHFVAVSDATGAEFGTALYVDGVRRSVQPIRPILTGNASNLMIGENPEARQREYEGQLDDFAIWRRALTPAEVVMLYGSGAGLPLGTILGGGTSTNAPPLILQQPRGARSEVGATVSFQVTAFGAQPMAYQWRSNGLALPGATNEALVVANLQPDHASEYSVVVANAFGAVTSLVAVLTVAVPSTSGFVNGDFEEPRLSPGVSDWQLYADAEVPGWSTTADDRLIEIWSDGFMVSPYAGAQHLEINAFTAATVYQDAPGVPVGTPVGFEFAHRGRSGPETVWLTITDLGRDGAWGGGDDTTLFQKDYTTDLTDWAWYSSRTETPLVSLGNPVRVAFESRIQDSMGNLLDAVDYGPGVGGPPPTNAPPWVTRQPAGRTSPQGATVVLQVTVFGTPPFTYQWQKGGLILPGSTNASLVLTNLQPDQVGDYRVGIANAFGAVTSQVATLKLTSPDSHLANVALGKPVTLECGTLGVGCGTDGVPLSSLTDGIFRPQGTYYWDGTVSWSDFNNVKALVVDLQGTFVIESMVVQTDDNDSYLVEYLDPTDGVWKTAWRVPNATVVDGVDVYGMQTRPNPKNDAVRHYLGTPATASKLRFSSDVGDGTYAVSEIQAFAAGPPQITRQPEDRLAWVGDSLTLEVGTQGTPPLTHQWRKDGTDLPGATAAALGLTNIPLDQAGEYSVVVANALGSVTSRVAVLTLQLPPTIRYVTNVVVVATLAGAGRPGWSPDGSGTNFTFNVPNSPTLDFAGNLLVADANNHRICRIQADGWVSTIAGSGTGGYLDGFWFQAQFMVPLGVCADTAGNVFVADSGNNRVRKIASGGMVSTVAGTGVGGYGDGSTAAARLNYPNDLVVDPSGTLWVTEFDNHTVRRITTAGQVSTWVGNGQPGYVDGPRADARLMQPAGIARDAEGNLYVTEYAGQRVRKVTAAGVVSTLAGDGQEGYVDGEGRQARFRDPDGIGVDSAGYLYVVDKRNHALRRIRPDGYVETVAGTGRPGRVDGPGLEARFWEPNGVGMGSDSIVFVTDGANHLVRRVAIDPVPVNIVLQPEDQTVTAWSTVTLGVTATGTAPLTYQWLHEGTNVPGATAAALVLRQVSPIFAGRYRVVVSNLVGAVTSREARLTITLPSIFVTNRVVVSTLAGSGLQGFIDGAGTNARFVLPNGGAFDAAGSLYIADTENHRIRRITPDGVVSTYAGRGGAGYTDGFASASRFSSPLGVCVDAAGNVFVADSGNHRIRKISTAGMVSTLAGTGTAGYRDGPGTSALLRSPNDLVVDAAGNVFFTEFENHTVRRIAPDGTVITWVGNGQPGYVDGPWAEARLNGPGGIAVDAEGSLYVTEYRGQRIRVVKGSGTVGTLAGDGVAGYRDGPAIQAQFRNPDGIVVDRDGYVYVADNGNHALRRISPEGLVETVAGWGAQGWADGWGSTAQFAGPAGLALDRFGVLYVADSMNQRVRRVAINQAQVVVVASQPESQTVEVGGRAVFGLIAQGMPPLGYRWWKDGAPIAGTAVPLLVLSDVRLTSAGRYWVEVTNAWGRATSEVAILTVKTAIRPVWWSGSGHWYARVEAPGIGWTQARQAAEALTHQGLQGHLAWLTSAAENRFVTEAAELGQGTGEPLEHCWIGAYQTPEAAEPAGGWTWSGGEPVEFAHWGASEPNDAAPGEDHAMLEGRPDADGKPWSDAPEDGRNALGLLVEFEPLPGDTRPPVLVLEPEDQLVFAGKSAVFRVEAVSSGPPAFGWLKDGVTVAGSTNATFVLAAPTTADAGEYRAIVANAYGAVTSRVAVLTVAGGGPGTLYFANRSVGLFDARVMVQGTETIPADGRFVAQLHAGPPGTTLRPVGTPVAFAETPEAALGYVLQGGVVEVPGVGPGQPVEAKMVAWLRGYGADFESVKAGGCYWGESGVISLTAGGGLLPPALLVGLQGFVVSGNPACTPLPPNTGSEPVPGLAAGHWYQRVDAPFVSWSQARRLAEGMAFRGRIGHLVSLTSAEENRFLTDHPQLGNGTADLLNAHWIGAFRPAEVSFPDAGWRWVTDEAFDYANWRPQQTNEPPGVESHALFLHGTSNAGKEWGLGTEVGPASVVLGYVVEYEGGEAPRFLAEPESRTVILGDTATLVSSATGTTPIRYRWFTRGPGLSGVDADQPSLVLTNAQLWHAGDYWVVASNALEAITSRVATLTVRIPIEHLTNAVVSTLSGAGVPGSTDGWGNVATFRNPLVGALDEEGTIYLADSYNNTIRKVTYEGVVTTLAGSGLRGYRDGPALTAQFNDPQGLARDRAGSLVIADTENQRLRRFSAGTTVTSWAGSGTAGMVDGPAASAAFRQPRRVVADAEGNVYLADYGNHVVRRIDREGTVSTWAGTGQAGHQDGPRGTARFQSPLGIAVDATGQVFVAEEQGGHRIRRINADGEVTTIAGTGSAGFRDGPGSQAQFHNPAGLAVDPAGHVYIADTGNHAIRMITPEGKVVTVAGNGVIGSGDGPGAEAQFSSPTTVAIDVEGVLYVGDGGNFRIRKVRIGTPPVVPPRITQQPQGGTIAEGEEFTLRVQADGPPPLRYGWYKNGLPLSGATLPFLALTRVVPGDAGDYWVRVTNRYAAVTSVVAVVKVVPPTSPNLVNGDFEEPPVTPGVADTVNLHQAEVPGWSTSAGDRLMKLWTDGAGVRSFSGSQHAELNLYAPATWYEDLTGYLAGAQLGFAFAHRGRNMAETLELTVTDLGADGVYGGIGDTVLFRRQYTTGTGAWARYDSRSESPIVALGNTVRVAFESLVKGSMGNLLDAVEFGPGVAGALPADSPPVIVGQPVDLELAVGESAALQVIVAGGTPLDLLWTRPEGPIGSSNATTALLTFPNVQLADAGHYSVRITNPYGTTHSRVATVRVANTPRPRLLSATTRGDPSRVTVIFSMAMDPISAAEAGHYRLADGSPVFRATITAPDTVVLDTRLATRKWHTLVVDGVRATDADGLPVAPDSRVTFALTDAHVTWRIYDGVTGVATADDFVRSSRYTRGWASRNGYFDSFEFPGDDRGAQLAGQLRAYVYPPVSGDYRFFVWGDDSAALYLSPSDDPRKKSLIARLVIPSAYRVYGTNSPPVALESGKRYLLEAVYLETDDRDGVGVAWQLPGGPPPKDGDPPIQAEYLESDNHLGAPFVKGATTIVAADVGQPWGLALDWPDLGGSPPYVLQWTWNGAPVAGWTNLSFQVPWIEPADAGARVGLTVSNRYGSTNLVLAVLSPLSDTYPPRLEWVEANARGDEVSVRFSEAVTGDSATNLPNYTLSGGPTIRAATRDADGRTVLLQTTAHTPGADYELAVRGLRDFDGNRMPDEERMTFPAFIEQSGMVVREVWNAARIGIYLDNLLDLPAFELDRPTFREVRRGAEAPRDADDHYGQRVWGWIVPPVGGEYRLAIAGDENAALYLGSDDSRTDLELVAWHPSRTEPREWGRYATQISHPRVLEAGRWYAFEALMTEGRGGDHLALGWVKPGAAIPELIDDSALRLRLDPRRLVPTITRQPTPVVAYRFAGGQFSVTVVPGSFVPGTPTYQWQRDGVDIAGATKAEFLLPTPLDPVTDSGALYRCVITDAAGNRVVSGEASLTVLPQAEPARISLTRQGNEWVLVWPGEPGVRLQQATRLRNPDWSEVPGTEGTSRVVLPMTPAARYFRLTK